MKHISCIIGALCMAAAFVSCSDNLSDKPIDKNLVDMTFSASSDEPAVNTDTKTLVNYQCQILWQETDALSIFPIDDRQANYRFTLKSGSGTKSAVFEGAATSSSLYFALYPYLADAQLNSGGLGNYLSFRWNGSSQTAVKDSFDPSLALMAGSTIGSGITFKNLCSFIKISTDFPCKSISFSSPDANFGSSDVRVSFDSEGLPSLTKPGTHSEAAAVLTAPDNGTIEPGTYMIAILPAEVYDFEVKITTTTGVVLSRTGSYWNYFRAGKTLNLGLFTASSFKNKEGFIGSGTEQDPYLIGNKQQFELLSELLSGANYNNYISKCYRQTADIDFGGTTAGFGSRGLNGTYDGAGHKMTNIVLKSEVVNSSDKVYASALICTAKNAKISNLTVECAGFQPDISDTRKMLYGGFIGLAKSTQGSRVEFQNCTFKRYGNSSVNLTFGSFDVSYGGFVAANKGNLKCVNCTNEVPVNARPEGYVSDAHEYSIGGFVGKIWQDSGFDYWCNFNKCRNNADILLYNATDNCYSGGFVGYVYECAMDEDCTLRLVNCINRGNVTAACNSRNHDSFAGGLVGKHDSNGGDCGDPLIFNCMNSGTIGASGKYAYAGGIFGWNYDNDTRICACVNVGNITGDDAAATYPRPGALCGTDDGEYYNCAFTSGKILYDTSVMADNIHGAFSIDDNAGQLPAAKMNELATSVSKSLRDELSNRTGFAIETWTGLWNHQNQQGLDLNY